MLRSHAVDIISDDDEAPSALSPPHRRFKGKSPVNLSGNYGGGGVSTSPFLVIDDDPTPQKPITVCTPSFVPETPLSFGSNESIGKCSLARTNSRENLAGFSSLICLESDNDSEGGSNEEILKKYGHLCQEHERTGCLSILSRPEIPRLDAPSKNDHDGLFCQSKGATCENVLEVATSTTNFGSFDGYAGDNPSHDDCLEENLDAQERLDNNEDDRSHLRQSPSTVKQKRKRRVLDADNNILKNEAATRKKELKEEKIRLMEERKKMRQEEKLQKKALKAEADELKRLEKEKQKWENGKLALKSIIAEIDSKILENGSIGGHLLTRFAERGLSYRITSNPIERSVLWKMTVPEKIAQLSDMTSDVPYILLLYHAKEFCDLVISESFMDHAHTVKIQFPLFTICYLTNRLMSFINKCEQSHYKCSSNSNEWKRPPVEEALSKLSTHFTKVHSRQCIDEAEVADHIVGLTSSLASCQFRKKLTWLSVNANGSIISMDFIDKKLIKKNVWMKALVSIPKVQPRHAIAVWKKYPTMRSLLDVYMDSSLSVHEKEFLLKDLMVEGLLGREDRRLGEVCSKRIFRVLMAQSGCIRTDDIEDGADLFKC